MRGQLSAVVVVFAGLMLLLLVLMRGASEPVEAPLSFAEYASLEPSPSAPSLRRVPTAQMAPKVRLPEPRARRARSPREFKRSLLEVLDGDLPAWQDCLTDDTTDGVVRVRLIAAHDETPAPVIETADIDHDESTIADPKFRECLRQAALAMVFETLPDDVNAVAIGYAVRVANGAIAGSEGREFSYLRDEAR